MSSTTPWLRCVLILGATVLADSTSYAADGAPADVSKQTEAKPPTPAKRKPGAAKFNVAVDTKWNDHEDYLQRFIEIVQTQWERELVEGNVFPPVGSTVKIRFVLNSDGVPT